MSSSSHPDAPPYSQASSSNAQQSCQPQNDFPRQLPGLGSGQLQTQYVDHSGLQQSFEDTQQTPHSSQALSMGVDISGIQMSFLTAQDQDELEGYFKSVIGDQESLDETKLKHLLAFTGVSDISCTRVCTLCNIDKSGRYFFAGFALAVWLCELESTGHDIPSSLSEQTMNQVELIVDQNRQSLKNGRVVFSFIRHFGGKDTETRRDKDEILFSQFNAEFRELFCQDQPVFFENTRLVQSARDLMDFPKDLVEKLNRVNIRDPIIFVLNGPEALTVNIEHWRYLREKSQRCIRIAIGMRKKDLLDAPHGWWTPPCARLPWRRWS